MLNLASSLNSSGANANIIAVRTDGEARYWYESSVPLLDLKAKRTLYALPKLIYVLRNKIPKPDVLFSTMVDANIAALIAYQAMHHKPKLVLRETNSHRSRNDIKGIRRYLIGAAYRSSDCVVALSEGVRRELIADYNIPVKKTVTIHNPVQPACLDPMPPRPAQMPAGRIVIGVGRLVRQKNFSLLVKALVDLPGDVHAVILGDGPDRHQLIELAKKLGVENRLRMPGYVKTVRAWLAHADVFALTSRWEGFGHVIVEAMDAGLPVVATDCPHGPRDIITDRLDGYLIPNEDQQALTSSLRRILFDKAYSVRIATAGKLRAKAFDADRIAAQYQDVFRRLTDNSRST